MADDSRNPEELNLPAVDDPDGEPAEITAPRPNFLGEIVHRRSWPLIAVVFVFGLFLALVPFLFQTERSPFSDALAMYDRVCASNGSPALTDLSASARTLTPQELADALGTMPCVHRADYLPRMDPMEGRQYGTDRAFVVTMQRRTTLPASDLPETVRFMVEEESGTVRWTTWPNKAP